jgi:DNA-binding PadR family transcriptional regulator
VNRSGFEVRRHDYALTDDGSQIVEAIKRNEPEAYQNIRDAVQRIRGAGDPDYLELSIAAKTYLILKRKGRPLTADEVRSAARELNWEITEQSIQKAVGLLEKLGFVQTT